MTGTDQICKVCREILCGSDNVSRACDILEILQALVNTNLELLQDVIICETCVAKVQSAYKFKVLHSECHQHTFEKVMIEEEQYLEEVMCELCKKTIVKNDILPFLNSTSNKLILSKHFSMQYGSKLLQNLQTCKECHTSLLNFCTITNSISIFEQSDSNINKSDDINELKEFQHASDDLNNFDCVNIKEENLDWSFNVKEEDVNCSLRDMKKEIEDNDNNDNDAFQEFQLKSEEVDLKLEEMEGNERNWKYDVQSLEIEANFSTRSIYFYEDSVKNTQRTARNINEVDMFECKICKFQTKFFSVSKGTYCNTKTKTNLNGFSVKFAEYNASSNITSRNTC